MVYELRVVAFIDILGFTVEVNKATYNNEKAKNILCILNELKDFFITKKSPSELEVEKNRNADTQIIQVSDSLVISRLMHEQGGIFHMLQDCSYAIHLLINRGFLCRGSIKWGYMYHKNTTLFGPAFQEAYEAENKEDYPIVRFNKELFDLLRVFPGSSNVGNGEWSVEFVKKNCKQIDDDYYLDYFTDYDDVVGDEEGSSIIHYKKLRTIIVGGLKSTIPNSRAYLKNKWAAEKFNLTASAFGLLEISIDKPC